MSEEKLRTVEEIKEEIERIKKRLRDKEKIERIKKRLRDKEKIERIKMMGVDRICAVYGQGKISGLYFALGKKVNFDGEVIEDG